MKNKNYIPEEIEFKKVLSSIKTERPSDDFTLSVMERIANEKIVPASPSFGISRIFYLIIIPLFTLIGSIIILIYKYTDISFDFVDIDLSLLTNRIMLVLEGMQKSISPSIIFISLACFLLYSFFILTNNRNLMGEN